MECRKCVTLQNNVFSMVYWTWKCVANTNSNTILFPLSITTHQNNNHDDDTTDDDEKKQDDVWIGIRTPFNTL